MSSAPSILVTGSHRSGTTWVGRMLALSPDHVYIHEPFNVDYPHDLFPGSFDRWFRYDVKGKTLSQLSDIIDFKYPLYHHLKSSQSPADVKKHVKASARYTLERWRGQSVVWKDPIALLSAERLAEAFDLEVLVMIRHPAAFAGSLKEKGWAFPFEDLLSQDRLMEELLSGFAEEVEQFGHEERHVVDQAALLWSILYDVVSRYRERHPSWLFLRHEDVALNPIEKFRSLYQAFGLDFTEEVQETIAAHSKLSEGEPGTDTRVCRDSESVIYNWKDRLTDEEIRRVRKRTEPIAKRFYADSEW